MTVKKITIEVVHPQFYKGFKEGIESYINSSANALNIDLEMFFL